jgi:hypothetical protein
MVLRKLTIRTERGLLRDAPELHKILLGESKKDVKIVETHLGRKVHYNKTNLQEIYQSLQTLPTPELSLRTAIGGRDAEDYIFPLDAIIPGQIEAILSQMVLIERKKYPKTAQFFQRTTEEAGYRDYGRGGDYKVD